jgi:hypothetical protein
VVVDEQDAQLFELLPRASILGDGRRCLLWLAGDERRV